MTIANETNRSGPYSYNGATTEFAYEFKISNETHIRVVEAVTATGVETDLVLNTDYTVTGVGSDTGNVVISPARASGKTVTLVLDVPFTQLVELENQGAYFAKVVEGAFDLAAQRDKQLSERLDRAVVVPVTSTVDPDALIADLEASSAAAVASAAAAAADAVQTAADRVQTGLDRVATAADRVQTGLDAAATAADRVVVAADKATVATNKGLVDTAKAAVDVAKAVTDANVVLTNADAASTAADAISTAADAVATAADRVQTGIDAAAAAASAASVDVTSMDWRPSLIVNGSMIDSQERGNTLGTANGYFAADQFALYFTAATAAVSIQRIQSSRSLAGAANKLEFKTTTAKASLGASDFVMISQPIEGSRPDFVAAGWGAAGAKQFVYRHEMSLPAGLYHLHVQNSAGNRHIAVPFTVAGGDANVAKVHEIVVPGDTAGTWLTADGVIGAVFDVVLAAGATLTNAAGASWGATAYYAAATQFNILSSTANVARLADVGLKLDPDATGVYGAYEVGEVDAVYRSERYALKRMAVSFTVIRTSSSGVQYIAIPFGLIMAKVPSSVLSNQVNVDGAANVVSSIACEAWGITTITMGGIIPSNARYTFDAFHNARLS